MLKVEVLEEDAAYILGAGQVTEIESLEVELQPSPEAPAVSGEFSPTQEPSEMGQQKR